MGCLHKHVTSRAFSSEDNKIFECSVCVSAVAFFNRISNIGFAHYFYKSFSESSDLNEIHSIMQPTFLLLFLFEMLLTKNWGV